MENVGDLLQLSDEYQVKQHIFDPCVKFLEDQPKTKENVMKILALADLYNLEKVHQGCIDLLKNMRLESLSETIHFQDLDREKTRYYLTKRIEHLETFLDEAFPQFFGVVASLVLEMFEHGKNRANVIWCSKHVRGGKFYRYISMEMMAKCIGCKSMLRSMARVNMCALYNLRGESLPRHGGNHHFNDDLFSIMENFVMLTGKKVTFDHDRAIEDLEDTDSE